MGESEKTEKGVKPRRFLRRAAIACVVILALALAAAALYLSSPLPARQVSQLVSSYLHQDLSIDNLKLAGGTMYLKGVKLANPSGFPKGNLAVAESVAIAPAWRDLISGGQSYRLVSLERVSISLEKNAQGTWNYSQLQQLLAKRKPSPKETRIQELRVTDGSLAVAGRGVSGISLKVFNLATKGSASSPVELSFEDGARNRFTLKGQVRPGADPALDLALTAPALSLQGLATQLGLKNPERLAGGTGSLQVNASFHKGDVAAQGTFRFAKLSYLAAGRRYPLAGSLDFDAEYRVQEDAARLRKFQLTANDMVQVHAAGSVRDLKKERQFTVDAGFGETDLATVSSLLPEKILKGLTLGGTIACPALHLAGTGTRITSASGKLQVRNGSATRAGRLYLAGLNGTADVSRAGEGVLARGRLAIPVLQEKAMLQSLDLPFNLSLSRQWKPVQAASPQLSAQAMGIPFSGRISYDARRFYPVTASLKTSTVRLAKLQPLLERYGVREAGGIGSAAVDLSGKDPKQLEADLAVRLAEVKGSRGKIPFALAKGAASAKVRRGGGHLRVEGNADLKGAAYSGKGGDARFHYRTEDRTAFVNNAEGTAAGVQLSVAHLSGTIPHRKRAAASSVPIEVDFDGARIRRRDLEIGSLGGRFRGSLFGDAAGRWLEGAADLAAGRVSWQGKEVAAPAAHLVFSRPGAQGELSGKLLGGALSGRLSGNPFAARPGANFDLALKEASAAALAPFLPKSAKYSPSHGVADLRLTGSFSGEGFSCRLDGKATGLALVGSGGKTLISGTSLAVTGGLERDKLALEKAVLSPAPGVALTVKGELAHPFKEERSGRLTFSLAEAAVNSMVDPLVNLMPRAIQEATLDGALAAQGRIEFQGGEKLLEGDLVLKGGRFELAQQKLAVSGITGKFPFSLDLSRKTGAKPPAAIPFSRENFPQLLAQMSRAGVGGDVLTIGKVAFGPMELGNLILHLTAQKGITEITSLKGSLYQAVLLGKGYLTMHEGLGYRGDLLIDGLSLKQLCSMFPGIQGYISGRVDGVLSISGGTKGLSGISGFTDLWAREGGGEKMLVSKDFLQRLAKQKLSGFFIRSDRPYDAAEIKALMEGGYLTFEALKIEHTNLFGVRDIDVSVSPTQNRIELVHLLDSIKEAASRGKPAAGTPPQEQAPAPQPGGEFKWEE